MNERGNEWEKERINEEKEVKLRSFAGEGKC